MRVGCRQFPSRRRSAELAAGPWSVVRLWHTPMIIVPTMSRRLLRRLRDRAYTARQSVKVVLAPAQDISDRARYEAGLAAVDALAKRVLPGYVMSEYGRSWQSDNVLLDRLRALEPESRSFDRKVTLIELLKLITGVPGDTVEVGVFRGASSVLICEGTAGEGRTHFAVDSYEGLSAPGDKDGGYWNAGDMAAPEAAVRERLSQYPAYVIRGWVPNVLGAVPAVALAFAHIDVDLYEPTCAASEWAYERLSPGGILLCDDYGFASCPGARRGLDEVLAKRPEPIIHLPTGQGLVIKQAQPTG
jgi:O-methyltransferase